MGMVKNDEQYLTAITSCSDNIKKFLMCLNNKDSRIRWDRLERDDCIQSDGSIFRVVSSVRTAEQQISEFKKGRKGIKYDSELALLPTEYVSVTPATQYKLTDGGQVVNKAELSTMAWAGQSKHNWGLAVDIVIRKWGEKKVIPLSDGSMSVQNYYSLVGLTQLARDCGLEWGGDWTDLIDVAHFEDSCYSIPSEKYWYNRNMTFDFLRRLKENNGLVTKSVISKLSLVKGGLLALSAVFLCRFFRGKK